MNRARYRPDIDGLRAIAVGAVMIYHAFPARLPGGFVGVDVFFVISGYLISGIILGGLGARRFTFADFYARRIRRIFPALALVLASVLAAGWFLLYADDYERLGHHAAAGAAFVSNFALWREAGYFDVSADLKPLLHLWSLGIEEQFYLVWPLLLVLAARWRRGPLAATLIVGSLSFVAAIWIVRIDRTPAFFSPVTRFWELLAGATLACAEADAALSTRLHQFLSSRTARTLASVVGIVLIAAGVLLIGDTSMFPGFWVLLPVTGTFLLLVAGSDALVNRTVLSQRPIVWIGLISYPLYLWHWPLLSFAHLRYGDIPPTPLRLALLGTAVMLAWLTYRVIETPVRFGARSRGVVAALTMAMIIVGATGLGVALSQGLTGRAINRNEAARLIHYYDRMKAVGIAGPYHLECDFMDFTHQTVRAAIDPSCTVAGSAHTVLLWGDSFAQALSPGIRDSLPAGTSLAQVATSACRPEIENFDPGAANGRCEKADLFAMSAIKRLRPDIVIVAQSGGHTVSDWPRIVSKILALGAGRVVVVGPFPLWRPSLPRVYAEHHLQDHAEYVGTGLDLDAFDNDRTVAARVNGVAGATYLSLIEHLCRDRACLARVPGEDPLELMALDFGHLTPKGSAYLGRVMWRPFFAAALR